MTLMTEREEDNIQKLRSAQAHLDEARRHFQTSFASPWTCDEIKAGLMWAVEAWLLKHGHKPNCGNGWHSMQSQFFSIAPDKLKSEFAQCLSAILLLEGPDAELDGGTITYKSSNYSSLAWQEALRACLARAEEILQTIATDVKTV